MPRPPILPVIDWKSTFDTARAFDAWLDAAEHSAHRQAMLHALDTLKLTPEDSAALAGLSRPLRVLAIAEDWCGDVVRHVPALELLNRSTPMLDVRYIFREERPDIFARFLTNGGEAIPKFIFLSEGFVEYANWGPMPETCKRLIARGKATGDVSAARREVSARYEADPQLREVFGELIALLKLGGDA